MVLWGIFTRVRGPDPSGGGALGPPSSATPSSPVMCLLLVLLPSMLLQNPVMAQIGLNEERAELLREIDCARECRSMSQVAVCGTNGKTYNNLCKLQSDACKSKGTKVKVKHQGECTLTEMCPDDRRAKLYEVSLELKVFVPRCNPDGTYASIQCHEYSNYCWCSKLDGTVVSGTIAEGKQPNCSEAIAKPPPPPPPGKSSSSTRGKEFAERQYQQSVLSIALKSPTPKSLVPMLKSRKPSRKPRRKSRGGKKQRGPADSSTGSGNSSRRCEGKRLKEFKESFTKHVKKEYARDNKKGSKKRSDGKKFEKEALRWKFKQLDKNKDSLVRRAEYKGLRRLVRKQLQPRKCAKQFPNFCDIDNNKNLAENEWVNCFMPSNPTPSKCCKCQVGEPCKCKASNICTVGPFEKAPVVSCEREREAAKELQSTNSAIYKPTCTPDGLFEAIQCYDSTGYCWCVDVKTGQSLEGTTVEVKYGKPICDKPLPHATEWPGCESEKKIKFMKNFQSFLNKTVSDIAISNVKRENQNMEEFAANNFFNQLDSNNNGFLEKKEKKLIRKKLQKDRKLKKCAKKLSMYCDWDNDRKISKEEWIACSIMPKNTEDPNLSSRRNSENPFETILVAEE